MTCAPFEEPPLVSCDHAMWPMPECRNHALLRGRTQLPVLALLDGVEDDRGDHQRLVDDLVGRGGGQPAGHDGEVGAVDDD
jgi:hypothetical protein